VKEGKLPTRQRKKRTEWRRLRWFGQIDNNLPEEGDNPRRKMGLGMGNGKWVGRGTGEEKALACNDTRKKRGAEKQKGNLKKKEDGGKQFKKKTSPKPRKKERGESGGQSKTD